MHVRGDLELSAFIGEEPSHRSGRRRGHRADRARAEISRFKRSDDGRDDYSVLRSFRLRIV